MTIELTIIKESCIISRDTKYMVSNFKADCLLSYVNSGDIVTRMAKIRPGFR